MFGLDRDAIRELMEPGTPNTSGDSFMPANDPRDGIVGKPFAAYPYDPGRAMAEWAGAGWMRAADGRVVDQSEQQVQVELRSMPTESKQVAAIASGWRSFGIDTREYITPPALTQDRESRSRFPAMEARGRGAAEDVFVSFDGRERATPENRWAGVNKGQYANPVLDRMIDTLYTSIDATERGRLMREMGGILAADLPAIPLYWATQFLALRTVVRGPIYEDYPLVRDPGGTAISRNAHLWDRAER